MVVKLSCLGSKGKRGSLSGFPFDPWWVNLWIWSCVDEQLRKSNILVKSARFPGNNGDISSTSHQQSLINSPNSFQ